MKKPAEINPKVYPKGFDMVRDQDRYLPIANVARIMKRCLPRNAKIAKEAKADAAAEKTRLEQMENGKPAQTLTRELEEESQPSTQGSAKVTKSGRSVDVPTSKMNRKSPFGRPSSLKPPPPRASAVVAKDAGSQVPQLQETVPASI